MSNLDSNKTRTATEYRLSIASRRSSLGAGITENRSSVGGTGGGGGGGAEGEDIDEENGGDNILQEYIVPQLQELTESVVTLDANMRDLNVIHDSLVDLNESVGALMYGLICNAFCIEFPKPFSDMQDALGTARELESLDKMKHDLLDRLEELRTSKEKGPNKGTVFQQPRLPKKSRTMNNKNEQTTPEVVVGDEEDNNSEASFVMNPTDNQRGFKAPSNSHDHSTMRRKSILHTVRNSIGPQSSAIAQQQRRSVQANNRHSLAGGATRLTVGSSRQEETTTTRRRRRATALPRARTRTSSTADRPPFR